MFEVGRVYNRRLEIHEPYGGQRYGGISTPRDRPFIFLFTGESGEQYGYEDGWDDNGVFVYTGEGQKGDMDFIGGNRAIRDHSLKGKDIHLFQALRRGGEYRYLGRFVCSTWEFRDGVDVEGNRRQVIVFHLIQPEEDEEASEPTSPDANLESLDRLRERARNATTVVRERTLREARRRYHERSAAVRNYVLARAGGSCESCGRPAPFRRQDGSAYLEPHHTRRLSDGGPDHPRWVGAVCPNCHQEIHHGAEGDEKNRGLQRYLGVLEEA
jgi:5-methylcytosine-specific restriction protein A